MRMTDIFIRRPVLATVVSLMILVLGLRSIGLLNVREFPTTESAVVTVTTTYTGADPALVAGFITTPLENSVAQANGIDYMQSASTEGLSTISVFLRLNYDVNRAVTEINTKVNAVLNQLPKNSQLPVITVDTGETIDALYMGFYSAVLESNQITDYLVRVIQPKLQAIAGVQTAEILGARQYAMRAWLDPEKLAGFGLTPTDVANALANNDFISAVGRTDGNVITFPLTAETGLQSVKEFQQLAISSQNNAIIRLGDVATVSLGATNYDTSVSFNGKQSVYIGIKIAPTANLLTVLDLVRNSFPELQKNLPTGMNAKIVYDSSEYVDSAIHEVIKSLTEATIIVTIVIFLFLGSLRSVVIPVIAIPLSLIGTFFIMLLLGYSINILTLLALVLAIGLVVDDAIIVVENIYRHMEEGTKRIAASIQGARELANPIIAISVVLIAVYVPIGFMGGLTGSLFTEFSFALAGSVTVSAIIALTLSPMMCSKILKTHKNKKGLVNFIDTHFENLQQYYRKLLGSSLKTLPVTMVFALLVLVSIGFLYKGSKSELAPEEDQGIIIAQLTAAPNASLAETHRYQQEVYKIFQQTPEMERVFQLDGLGGLNQGISGIGLTPWHLRKRTAMQIQPVLQQQFNNITGAKIAAFQRPPLPGGGRGLPIQFVIQGTENFDQINQVMNGIMDEAQKSGRFIYLDSDLKIDRAQYTVAFNRDMIAQMGLTMQDIGNALTNALSENYINYFAFDGRSYQVIPQMLHGQRINAHDLLNYYIKTVAGSMIPFSTVAQLKMEVVPESLNHFQQLNSATLSGIPFPGITMGDAIDTLKSISAKLLPQGYTIDFAGQSRQFTQEGGSLLITFFFALIIIYLSLAALFESFRDPLIVLISVPMSICGAMIFICLGVGGATLNIYSEVGLVTLIGLISKHGILIVQFANDLQLSGKSKSDAIIDAACIRLRPILMTTAATVFGVIPLILASGAGAESRFNIGLVIASGISIGTLFTLFVVPAMYMLIATQHKAMIKN